VIALHQAASRGREGHRQKSGACVFLHIDKTAGRCAGAVPTD
jgi:hypothetical protein